MKVLWQLQLSNYNNGKFSLTGDSNWTTFVMKARELKKHDPALEVVVLVPFQAVTDEDINHELIRTGLAHFVTPVPIDIPLNALASRYNFDFRLHKHIWETEGPFDVAYVNDPCLLGNFKAVGLSVDAKCLYLSQCHFLDCPSNPLVPVDQTYWWRTIEATEKADLNIWHCRTQEAEWADLHPFNHHKSVVWKSGHSTELLDEPINKDNLRFPLNTVPYGTRVIWVPNRIGGLGKSFDYTNNGRFLFEELPKVVNRDFVVICGNPSQKITNDEIAALVPEYIKLVDGPLNYDEYRWCTQRADMVVALYDKDSNGGIAVLEAMYNGAVPLMPDINEYKRYYDDSNWPYSPRVNAELSNIAEAFDLTMQWMDEKVMTRLRSNMQKAIEQYSIENTTKDFYEVLSAKLSAI